MQLYIRTLIDISQTVTGYQLHLEDIDLIEYMKRIESQANLLCITNGICLHMEIGTSEVNKCLKTILDKDYDIEIVAEANNAYTARDKIIECNPDVMILCNDLPGMPGIVFLKKLMPQRPVSTIVIAKKECEDAAYNSGAKDFIKIY